MVQIISALIFYGMFAVLIVLIFLIWRDGTTRIAHTQQALIDVTNKSAEAAKAAAEAAERAVALVEKKSDAV